MMLASAFSLLLLHFPLYSSCAPLCSSHSICARFTTPGTNPNPPPVASIIGIVLGIMIGLIVLSCLCAVARRNTGTNTANAMIAPRGQAGTGRRRAVSPTRTLDGISLIDEPAPTTPEPALQRIARPGHAPDNNNAVLPPPYSLSG
ncbi:hypothetical protein C8F01DRAFT_1122633 [Mycena amicta]|nr:hypothetical protein C8F01DRAFT_1122633 [Mycena amicta]